MKNKVVIIGSGIGGLTAAASLSHHGYEVHVFEYGKKLGGYLNPFKRKEYSFSPGMHIITEGTDSEFDNNLSSIGINLEFIPLNEDGFETYCFPDIKISLTKHQDTFFNELTTLFPKSKTDIKNIYAKIKDLGSNFEWLNAQPLTTKTDILLVYAKLLLKLSPIIKYRNYSWQQFLDKYTTNHQLKGILSAWCNAMGLPPKEVSCISGTAYFQSFANNGGWYVKGGTRSIRDKIKDKLIQHNVEIHLNSKVQKIVVENNRVKGIVLENNSEFVAADIVISNADPFQTYGKLLQDYQHPKNIQRLIKNYKAAISYYYLGLVIDTKGIEDNIIFKNAVIRYFASFDVNAHFDIEKTKQGEGPYIFMSCPSSKDKREISENTHILEIMSSMPFEAVKKWQQYKVNKRGEEYENIKNEIYNRVLDRLEEFVPDIRKRIKLRVDGSPLTNYSYTLNTEGAGVGMAMTAEQTLNRAPIKSHIKGMYNVGSGTTFGLGIVRCSKSGWEAAKQIQKEFAPSK